jgi:hypothetical protein
LKNFEHNRADRHIVPHTDYLIFIDADETLKVDANVQWSNFSELAYSILSFYMAISAINAIHWSQLKLIGTGKCLSHEYFRFTITSQGHLYRVISP